MRRFIVSTALVLTATAAAAAVPATDIQTSNQVLEPGHGSLTVDHVRLPHAGRIEAVAPDSYGQSGSGEVLGETKISAGEHSNVRLPINQKAMANQDYTAGTSHRMILKVRGSQGGDAASGNQIAGQTTASQSIKVRVPDPTDQID